LFGGSQDYTMTVPVSHFGSDLNTTLYGHFFMVRNGYSISNQDGDERPKESNTVYVIKPLTKLMPLMDNITRNLLSGKCPHSMALFFSFALHSLIIVMIVRGIDGKNTTTTNGTSLSSLLPKKAPRVYHWKTKLPLHVVNDYNHYPFGKLPADFAQLLQLDRFVIPSCPPMGESLLSRW
jgi:hypothetical protein